MKEHPKGIVRPPPFTKICLHLRGSLIHFHFPLVWLHHSVIILRPARRVRKHQAASKPALYSSWLRVLGPPPFDIDDRSHTQTLNRKLAFVAKIQFNCEYFWGTQHDTTLAESIAGMKHK